MLQLLLVVMAGLAALYVARDDEPLALDDSVRAQAGPGFLKTAGGHTRFEVQGPEDAEVVVLVHGTTVPSFVWDPNIDGLVRRRYRVIRYDLFGRGLSDRPDARYDLDFHVAQLTEVIAQLAPGKPVNLVGLSFGGVITAEYTRRHPAAVRRLALIGPAGIAKGLPFIATLGSIPLVGDYLMRLKGTDLLRPSRRNFHNKDRFSALDAAYLETIRFEGSRRAVLRTLRNAPIDGYENGYLELGKLNKPVLLVWGKNDEVIPFSNSDRVRELVRPQRFVAVEASGHLANYERPEIVSPALERFLADGPQNRE